MFGANNQVFKTAVFNCQNQMSPESRTKKGKSVPRETLIEVVDKY